MDKNRTRVESPSLRTEVEAPGSSGRKRERARARETRPRVSPSLARVFSCAHYFHAPATQATNPHLFALKGTKMGKSIIPKTASE